MTGVHCVRGDSPVATNSFPEMRLKVFDKLLVPSLLRKDPFLVEARMDNPPNGCLC